jgi:hypothetical protein
LPTIDDVVDELAAEPPDAELVKLRVFAGFTVDEASAALRVSRTRTFRQCMHARAWLRAEFSDEG